MSPLDSRTTGTSARPSLHALRAASDAASRDAGSIASSYGAEIPSNHPSYVELAHTSRFARSTIAMARCRVSIAALVTDQSGCSICVSAGSVLRRAASSSISKIAISAPPYASATTDCWPTSHTNPMEMMQVATTPNISGAGGRRVIGLSSCTFMPRHLCSGGLQGDAP